MAVRRRVVVVGLGSIGRRHARLLKEREDIQVEVVEPRVEALAVARQELGELRSHESFHSMLTTGPDVVWLATPTSLHADQAIAALGAGAHVFCEKPMCDRVSDAQRVIAAADRTDKVLNVGFYLHFWKGIAMLKSRIEQGALGMVLHAHARVGSYVVLLNSQSRYQATHPGSLFFDYSHQPDLFYWLFGLKPAAVLAAGIQAGNFELTSNPNVVDLICEYDSRLITSVHLNYAQMPERHDYEVVGDEGWAFLDFHTGTFQIGNRRRREVETEVFVQERDDIFRAEHQAFFEAAEGRRKPETSAADGLVSTAICEAAVRSWQSRQRVAVTI